MFLWVNDSTSHRIIFIFNTQRLELLEGREKSNGTIQKMKSSWSHKRRDKERGEPRVIPTWKNLIHQDHQWWSGENYGNIFMPYSRLWTDKIIRRNPRKCFLGIIWSIPFDLWAWRGNIAQSSKVNHPRNKILMFYEVWKLKITTPRLPHILMQHPRNYGFDFHSFSHIIWVILFSFWFGAFPKKCFQAFMQHMNLIICLKK